MFDIEPVTSENISELKPLYKAFQGVAQAEYGWPSSAVDFSNLSKLFQAKILRGYMIKNFETERHVGFLFYQIEPYGALEIKIIYLENAPLTPPLSPIGGDEAIDLPLKSILDSLFNRFIEDIKLLEGWEVVSYPMLGRGQARYIDFITWYGFKPVGQAVVKFNIFDGISIDIFKKQQYQELPEGYRFISWDPKYEEGVIDVLAEAFQDSVDALWDPRFRTRDGIKKAVAFVQSGGYGIFWPDCTTILLNNEDKPVGVCLLNIVGNGEANIPLIGLFKSEQRHKLGRALLAQTVEKCISGVMKGRLKLTVISATVATANVPAIRMYRHTSFQEDHWYPHIYQERNSVLTRRAGQWC